MKKKKVYLTLANGKVFQGYRFGAEGDAIGELVFSTGMVGYVETLTDPSNYGQMVVQTFPLIGNYGVNEKDAESDKAWLSAYIVREYCDQPSNFRSEGTLEQFMKKKGVVGVYGVDTRELTKVLREEGTMNARISDKALTQNEVSALAAYQAKDAVKAVSPIEKTTHGNPDAAFCVAVWNFGCKNSTISNLVTQDCKVISVPAATTAEEILALGVDGIVLSDGAGDPAENTQAVAQIKEVLGKKPVLAIGLGYQLMALALGAKTAKQKYGHRGGNQPVKCFADGRVYVSSQNHGYEVVKESVTQGEVSFVSVNDGSCEGIDCAQLNAYGVQFTPECCSLGNEVNPVYEKFFACMRKEKENA